jgi:hypothetical protein
MADEFFSRFRLPLVRCGLTSFNQRIVVVATFVLVSIS